MMRRLILPVACLALTAQLAAAGTYYVDAVAGNDNSGNGSQQHPWRTVTHAMSKVPGPGDVLRIAPGTYDAALGEAPEINVKSGITLQGAGKAATMIRARLVFTNLAQAPSVNNLLFNTMSVSVTGMHSGLNIASCMLDEGDYDHSYISLQAGAVFEPKILSTRIQGRDNKLMQITLTQASRMSGLVMHCDTYLGMDGAHEFDVALSSGSVFDTTFIGNLFHQKRRQGLCFWIGYDEFKPTNVFASHFINNTFTMSAFHLMSDIDYKPLFVNNIISLESGFWLLGQETCFNNLIGDGTFDGVNGNFNKPPRFVDEDKDFHLRQDSPCIDRGRNDAPGLAVFDREGVPRFLDGDLDTTTIVDLGSQEFGFSRLSWSGTPTPGGELVYHADGPGTFGGLLFIGSVPSAINMQRFGTLLLDPNAPLPLFMGWLPADLTVAIPNDSHLSGTMLYAQELAILPCLCGGTLSNRVDILIQ